mmetsp:Transcript_14603/g.21920  ORF Transcript_14603/g.21920 Transcript_14603/m.21920 type:complete len:109 (+) Transcript_14603:54-380(+)
MPSVHEETNEEREEREVREKLTALGKPNTPSSVIRSIFLLKFRQLQNMDPRRLDKDDSKNVTHVCTFCNTCFAFTWKAYKKKGHVVNGGSFDSTKAIRHITENALVVD